MRRPTRAKIRDERGTATAFVVGMSITLLAAAGLVVDGGTALNSRMKLADDVEQAARAGAQEIDLVTLRGSGVLRLDPTSARARAQSYLTSLGYTNGGVTVSDNTISVSATDVVRTDLLTLVGISTFDISATATAIATSEALTQ